MHECFPNQSFKSNGSNTQMFTYETRKSNARTKLKFIYAVHTSIPTKTIDVRVVQCTEYKTIFQSQQSSKCSTAINFACHIFHIFAKEAS